MIRRRRHSERTHPVSAGVPLPCLSRILPTTATAARVEESAIAAVVRRRRSSLLRNTQRRQPISAKKTRSPERSPVDRMRTGEKGPHRAGETPTQQPELRAV